MGVMLSQRKLECALETLARISRVEELDGRQLDEIAHVRSLLWDLLERANA
jgi:hypothetical protein